MEVDSSPRSSLGESSGVLSVVCSAPDYSSNSSSTPSPRAGEDRGWTWEKRRRLGDGVEDRLKRRASNDMMDHRLLALSNENAMLKTRLESRTASDSLLVPTVRPANAYPEMPALPSASATPRIDYAPKVPYPSVITSARSSSSSSYPGASLAAPSTHNLPILQLAHLQAAIQQQLHNSSLGLPLPGSGLMPPSSSSSLPTSSMLPFSTSSLFSSSSAFTPFHKDSVIKRGPDRTSPDSSTDYVVPRGSSSHDGPSTSASSRPSIIGQILSKRPSSPSIPASSTQLWSRLATPPREHSLSSSSSKSDCESAASSSSLSPSGSGEDHGSALARALGGDVDPKREAYMDRRRRNNEAAKRCRANRRAVFEFRSRRVQVLEGENEQLREEISSLRREVDLYKSRLAETGLPVSVITSAPSRPSAPSSSSQSTQSSHLPVSSSPSFSSD